MGGVSTYMEDCDDIPFIAPFSLSWIFLDFLDFLSVSGQGTTTVRL